MFIKRVHFHNNLYFWRCRRLQSLKSTHFAFKIPFYYNSKTLMPYMYFIRICIFVKDNILIHKSLYLVDVKLSWDKTVINYMW